MENKPFDLSQENRRVQENARRCIADAKALIARLDRLEFERTKSAKIGSIIPATKARSIPA